MASPIISLVLLAVVIGLAFLVWTYYTKLQIMSRRCSGIIDIDAELERLQKQREALELEQKGVVEESKNRRLALTQQYDAAFARYESLKAEVLLLEEHQEDMSFGLYKPHFNFGTPEAYKSALETVREKERELIKANQATSCAVPWTVNNSRRDGERMVRLQSKLLLRAFNGECDAAIANVSWNNVTKMEERIRKSFEAVNKSGAVQENRITEPYLALKLDEIRLTHELESKRYEEREEQRRLREEMREQERAEKEIEKAKADAEAEEVRYQAALKKAQADVLKATGDQLQKLTDQIATFEAKLDEARQKKERAISRAQLTKSGFVYVISNLGAFGEGVYKIGMTRRMEPMDRIIELGGASVPFRFDLHVMMYSDNAPDLEYALHQHFEDRRVNLVNPRREFYKNVHFGEIEQFIKARGLSAQFVKDAEAREYRESVAKRNELEGAKSVPVQDKFASPLFADDAPKADEGMQRSAATA